MNTCVADNSNSSPRRRAGASAQAPASQTIIYYPLRGKFSHSLELDTGLRRYDEEKAGITKIGVIPGARMRNPEARSIMCLRDCANRFVITWFPHQVRDDIEKIFPENKHPIFGEEGGCKK